MNCIIGLNGWILYGASPASCINNPFMDKHLRVSSSEA